jgi:hypothetical protein
VPIRDTADGMRFAGNMGVEGRPEYSGIGSPLRPKVDKT